MNAIKEQNIPKGAGGRLRRCALLVLLCFTGSRAAAASCDATLNVGSGQTYATIQAAVNAVPASLDKNYCVTIRDTATYAEQVTIQGFTNNGFRLTVGGDTAQASRPSIAPPVASTAAFVVQSDSITIEYVGIDPANIPSYGIQSSSSYLTVSSVTITDFSIGGSSPTTSAVASLAVSSYSTVSNTTIGKPGTYVTGIGSRFYQDTINSYFTIDAASDTRLWGCSGNGLVTVNGSTSTTIEYATLSGTTYLYFQGGSSGLEVTSSSLSGFGFVKPGSSGKIEFADNQISFALNNGLSISSPSATAEVWITSNTIAFSDGNYGSGTDLYGLALVGLTGGATVQYNGFYTRNAFADIPPHYFYLLDVQNSSGLSIHHNRFSHRARIFNGTIELVRLVNTKSTSFTFNDLYGVTIPETFHSITAVYLLDLVSGSTDVQLKNNVFASSFTVFLQDYSNGSSATLHISADSQPGFISDYNDFYSQNGVLSNLWDTASYSLLGQWQTNTAQDAHSISGDPLWNDVSPGVEDFHPSSTSGRYNPATGAFVVDSQLSPTIDLGDPAQSFAAEPAPNGGRVNQGSWANTAQASKSGVPAAPGTPAGFATTISSINWTWSSSGGAASYRIYAASDTANPLGTSAVAFYNQASLSTNTAYGVVVQAVNAAGDPGPLSNSATAYTLAAPPTSFLLVSVATTSAQLSWAANTNPATTQYRLRYWDAVGGSTTTLASTLATTATISGLSEGSSYYFSVAALNGDGRESAPTSTATFTQTTPGAPGTPSGVGTAVSSIVWTWSAASAAVSYRIFAASDTLNPLGTSVTTLYTQMPLSTNTAYGIVVQAIGSLGDAGPLSASATNYTLAAPATGFSVVSASTTSIQLSWAGNTNPPSTQYRIKYWDSIGASTTTVSPIPATTATITGLSPATSYYFIIYSLNGDNRQSTSTGPAVAFTLPTAGIPGTPATSQVNISSIVWTWSAALQAASYRIYAASDTTHPLGTSASASYTQLSIGTNTVHGIVVQALNVAGDPGPLSGGATAYTLAASPANAGFLGVSNSSLTVSWSVNTNPASTQFRASLWQTGGSTTSVTTTATSAGFTSLSASATYFVRVDAVNGDGVVAISSVTLSTTTSAAPTASSTIDTSGGTISLNTARPISLTIPTSAFTQSVPITLSLPSSFPSSAAQDNLTGIGVGVDVDLGGGPEPVRDVTLTLSYLPADVSGHDANRLVLARYDPTTATWVPLVSSVDTTGRTVTAKTGHLSLFQIMAAAPGSSVASAKAYPNPWKISRGVSAMTFSSLPESARIRIYTLTGALVKDLTADLVGMAQWDGTNQSGARVASGFYFVYAQGSGQKRTMTVAVER